MKTKWEYRQPEPADQFKMEHGWEYSIPFIGLDPEYGRIEVEIEPLYHRSDNTAVALLVNFRQTRDPRHVGKVYRIQLPHAGMLTTFTHSEKNLSFFAGVWSVYRCPIHKSQVFNAYAPGRTSMLRISALSTSTGVWFE
jgi:hypothetical protein